MELFQLKKFEHAWLMMSLDGKNLRAGVCPNPGNSKPSISIMFTVSFRVTCENKKNLHRKKCCRFDEFNLRI